MKALNLSQSRKNLIIIADIAPIPEPVIRQEIQRNAEGAPHDSRLHRENETKSIQTRIMKQAPNFEEAYPQQVSVTMAGDSQPPVQRWPDCHTDDGKVIARPHSAVK